MQTGRTTDSENINIVAFSFINMNVNQANSFKEIGIYSQKCIVYTVHVVDIHV